MGKEKKKDREGTKTWSSRSGHTIGSNREAEWDLMNCLGNTLKSTVSVAP